MHFSVILHVLFIQGFQSGQDGFIHAYAKVMGGHLNGILAEQGGLFQAASVDEQGKAFQKIFACVYGTAAGAGFICQLKRGGAFKLE